MNSLKWILNQADENHPDLTLHSQTNRTRKEEKNESSEGEKRPTLTECHPPLQNVTSTSSLDSLASVSVASCHYIETRSKGWPPSQMRMRSPLDLPHAPVSAPVSASASPERFQPKGLPALTKGGLPARRPGRKPKYAIPELLLSTSGLNQSMLPRSLTNSGILIITEEFQFDFRALLLKRSQAMASLATSSEPLATTNHAIAQAQPQIQISQPQVQSPQPLTTITAHSETNLQVKQDL